ncbi:MAG: DUF2514 family protein, partial [Thermomicrobiales bacterium]
MTSRIEAILAAVMAAAIIGLASWLHLSRVHAAEQAVHAHYAQVLAGIRDKTAEAAAQYRAQETAWRASIERIATDGQTALDTARADAAAAGRAADGLRTDLARYRAAARTAQDPGAAAAGAATGDALDLLADLFQRADARAGELAAAADLAHAA